MIVHLITAVALSALLVLFVWAGYRTLNKAMPKSMLLLVAASTAIGYGIYSEYTWADRTLTQLPESVVVVHEFSGRSVFSPWAYVLPRVDRLSVVDTQAIRRNRRLPEFAIAELLFLQRFNPVIRARQLVDCAAGRRADLTMDQVFDDQGVPRNVQWQPLESQHRLLSAVCTDG